MTRADAMPAADAYAATRPASHLAIERTSHYLTMRDGVRIAIDVSRPVDAPGRLPTLVRQTRYFRALEPTRLGRWLGDSRVDPVNGRMRAFFVSRGYAWIDVDVRGSGASTGVWHSPWSPLEVEDGREILDWIVAQPWSNGRVGATGNSYDGTAAELMATLGHPALVACAPRCSLYDVYTDVAYPGGVRQEWFTAAWTRANQALDANHPETMVAEAMAQARPWFERGIPRRVLERALRLVFRRVRPVEGDHAAVAAALAERASNLDVAAAARGVEYRDDPQPSLLGPQTADAFSPSSYLDRARAARVPMLSLSGWFDAAYPHAAIKRHLSLGDARNKLVLGPWNHGVSMNVSPHAAQRKATFDLDAELLRFFDHHLFERESGITSEAAVRYYVMGAETWRSAPSWPPPDATPRALYLDARRTLSWTPPAEAAERDLLVHDPATGSGRRSRWRTLVSPFVVADYPDRSTRRLMTYTTAPLEEDLEIAGHPIVELHVTTDAPDGAVFAYLEEQTADAVHYVTEGALRLIHREVDGANAMFQSPAPYRSYLRRDARPMPVGAVTRIVFDLLPVAYRFARGSRIRVAFATADADHFAAVPEAAKTIAIERSPSHPSLIQLPVRR
ncbi:MAG: CocE/NonD family hydrolase [Deltaproteobacteria bacterium]|nr:CocE/NonD family hydrolase [Deltaproteobacteria bacterium]